MVVSSESTMSVMLNSSRKDSVIWPTVSKLTETKRPSTLVMQQDPGLDVVHGLVASNGPTHHKIGPRP
ncbi:hypothetical protein SeMB42_g02115 [Synchytrium endobioticum]|uniref:Uncharacterized protein n=1 Tax=Synchytrium endobioticum TaxID=286115 RepID=A0A507DHD7_9FUNG|nr:hypothetical protein SeMB42_g02115 [Synchytrium endobioticum]